MEIEPESVITWGTVPTAALGFSINFGVFAGRDVSRIEIERLAEALLTIVDGVAITAEHRSEFGQRAATDLHRVRVEIEPELLPADGDVERLRTRLTALLRDWLRSCLTLVSGQELTHAEILARDAVVDSVLGEG